MTSGDQLSVSGNLISTVLSLPTKRKNHSVSSLQIYAQSHVESHGQLVDKKGGKVEQNRRSWLWYQSKDHKLMVRIKYATS